MCIIRLSLLAFALVIQPYSSAAAQRAPSASFDCNATKDSLEKLVCNTPKLAEADRTMAKLYSDAKVSAFGEGPSNQLKRQRAWLKERDKCQKTKWHSIEECLADEYNDRLRDLAEAALFTDTPLALQTLQIVDVQAAPMYEAIAIYAKVPRGTNWFHPTMTKKREALLALIRPYIKRIMTDPSTGTVHEPLENDGVHNAEDVLTSDRHFASFLQFSSAAIEAPKQVPCAAIVKHPELMRATDSAFGGAIDGWIANTDCEETLPPVPHLDTLLDHIYKGWPNCEGTIRISLAKSYQHLVSTIRVANRQDIRSFVRSSEARSSQRMPRRKDVTSSDIQLAINELTAYYSRYQRVTASDARLFALSRVYKLMTDGQFCD